MKFRLGDRVIANDDMITCGQDITGTITRLPHDDPNDDWRGYHVQLDGVDYDEHDYFYEEELTKFSKYPI